MVSFFFLCHLCACFWIICATLKVDSESGTGESLDTRFDSTWLGSYYGNYKGHTEIYMISFYWTITTITTVGYGDISGTNMVEMIFCCVVMLIGVIAFGFANGSLASIMTNYDNKSGSYQEKINILNKAYEVYEMKPELYREIKKTLNFAESNDYQDLNEFV